VFSPTQFPLQHWLLYVQVSPTVGWQVKPVRQLPCTHVIVKLQSSLVRQTPSSTSFAAQNPFTQPYEQQSEWPTHALPVGVQVRGTGSTDGSPSMRQAARAARRSVARQMRPIMAFP
jgi:hypothetical protein